MSAHTPGPWHVNAVDTKRRRITGDETSTGWDKLQINGTNNTVATVYRPNDARLIAAAPRMLELLKLWELSTNHHVTRLSPSGQVTKAEARAILRDVEVMTGAI